MWITPYRTFADLRGVLYPAAFIPIPEECGLAIPTGEWVLREACPRARQWLDAGLALETMAVNISAVECRGDPSFDGVSHLL
jgi:EAL domain-containing protein (putative c-di-GMP-specific phosphodiesterase class I)